MNGLRWRLARWIAPAPIIRDPFPDEGGVVILYRGQDGPYRLEWSMRAERFRMKSTLRLPPLDLDRDDFTYRPNRAFTRFVGTVGG